MNCAELKTAVTSYLRRTDLVSMVPTFILLAESQMNRYLSGRLMVGRSDAQISAQFVTLPSDFVGVLAIKIIDTNRTRSLEYVDPETANRLGETNYGIPGEPEAYSIVGDELQLLPAPDVAYRVEMTYRKRLTPISADTDTNWVLTNHPDAYLYGTLLQSAPWLRDDERVPMWSSAFSTIMTGIVDQAEVSATLQMQPNTAPI